MTTTTAVLGLTVMSDSDSVDIATHVGTGISTQLENVLAGATDPGGGGILLPDSLFTLKDNASPTKKLQFQLSSITAGNTRTLTVPDASGTLAILSLAQTWSAVQTHSAQIAASGAPDIGASGARFGTAYVGTLDASTVVQVGTNPATAGAVRLANAALIEGRNAANDGNVIICKVDSSNRVMFGNENDTGVRVSDSGNLIEFITNAAVPAQVGTSALSIGSSIAPTGSGLTVGAASTNNDIWNASQGSGTASLFIGNASINVTSDMRLKQDIAPTGTDWLDVFSRVPVVDYAWNDPSDRHNPWGKQGRGRWTGVLAQALVQVPELRFLVNAPDVTCPDCLAGNLCLTHDAYWGVDLAHAVGPLIAAVQQLTARVAALEGN
jgi:hypothetical protein